mmetsp:Transcript_2142/g.8529  ORF Transcript_2142/g.8529 Transcript_2142/m.8529 type:complete len:249 (+) Transcript_2142:15-761(+)
MTRATTIPPATWWSAAVVRRASRPRILRRSAAHASPSSSAPRRPGRRSSSAAARAATCSRVRLSSSAISSAAPRRGRSGRRSPPGHFRARATGSTRSDSTWMSKRKLGKCFRGAAPPAKCAICSCEGASTAASCCATTRPSWVSLRRRNGRMTVPVVSPTALTAARATLGWTRTRRGGCASSPMVSKCAPIASCSPRAATPFRRSAPMARAIACLRPCRRRCATHSSSPTRRSPRSQGRTRAAPDCKA